MKISKIDPSGINFRDIFEENVCNLIENNRGIVLAGFENDELKGLAVYSDYAANKGAVCLKYVFVPESLRGRGNGCEVLRQSMEFVKGLGYFAIVAKLIENTDNILERTRFLLKNGFKSSDAINHFLSYYLQDLKETVFASKINQMLPLLKKVKFYKEVEPSAIRDFIVECTKQGIKVKINDIDLLFASFYVDGNKIKGFLNFKEVEENVLLLSEVYVDSSEDSRFVMPALLANSLKIASAIMPDETLIFMQLEKENIYNGVITVFGEPEHDDLIIEFIN